MRTIPNCSSLLGAQKNPGVNSNGAGVRHHDRIDVELPDLREIRAKPSRANEDVYYGCPVHGRVAPKRPEDSSTPELGEHFACIESMNWRKPERHVAQRFHKHTPKPHHHEGPKPRLPSYTNNQLTAWFDLFLHQDS